MNIVWVVKIFDVNSNNGPTCNPTNVDRIDIEIFKTEEFAREFMKKQSERFSYLDDYALCWNGDETLFDVDGKFILKLETKLVND